MHNEFELLQVTVLTYHYLLPLQFIAAVHNTVLHHITL